ncbi:MAG: DUF2235 domain-containing protein, partial [Sedimenticolaceae bacterium]
ERVHEIWFPGVHSDVGGGYRNDALSDITLRFMIERAKAANVTFKKPDEIDYAPLAPITAQDLAIEPDVEGPLHLKTVVDDKTYVAWLQTKKWKKIMAPRKIYVAVNDAVSEQPPSIHCSVFERKQKMLSVYNPPNLLALDNHYRIVADDGSIVVP